MIQEKITMATASFLVGGATQSLGSPAAQQLPRLTQETELQKLLADERLRSEQHKTNYQQLKLEHARLQDEYMQLQIEVKRTIEESRIVKENYKTLLDQTRAELAETQTEVEELRSKVMTPQKLEILKMQLLDEVERTYRDKFQKQEQEMAETHSELTKVRYELSFIKSEYEHVNLEHQRVLEEITLQHNAEVENLRKERDSTITRIQTENSVDSQKVRTLQRDNAQLVLKVKSVHIELEEVRSQCEKQRLEADSVTRTQSKQLAEAHATVRSLEAERESLRRQADSLQHELSSTGDKYNKMTSRIHELEKENAVYRNQLEEEVHRAKVDLTNIRMDMLKQRGDLERERDKLANLCDDLQTQIEIADHKIAQQASHLEEKEREIARRVQAVREEEFEKLAAVENEKLELEAKLQEIERHRIDEEAHKQADQEKVAERITVANSQRESAEKELLVLKTKIHHHEALNEQIQRERMENSELKSKISRLEDELSGYVGNEQGLMDQMIKLRNQSELLKEELRLTQDQMVKLQDNQDRIVSSQRAAFIDEKTQLELRIHDLEAKFENASSKLSKAALIHKKFKRKYRKVIEHLKEKLQLLEAEYTELDLEKQALSKCVPQDAYNRLKKQWKDLYRRHSEFRALLLPNIRQVPIGDMSFGTMAIPFDVTLPNFSFDLEQQHQEDLHLLKQRLDTLDLAQKKQLEELQDIGHSTLVDKHAFEDLESLREKTDQEKLSDY
ncbi:centrosomal protein of 83 kDa-like isoform X2 [Gigantopelta aegis]|uniref:centrosomal protein of 83 kDa-like isoform X2 n=1 Tax=Gigantopelta aegis TaxID=1735272 RepID=UPI001B888D1B|nr:centrosomal protein of 83 kDa-like isoform X2 [Gigantopelta aegis]